jgi:hypothetical protein
VVSGIVSALLLFLGDDQMTLLRVRPTQMKRRFAVGIWVCLCVLGLVPAAFAQTSTTKTTGKTQFPDVLKGKVEFTIAPGYPHCG